MNLDSKTSPFAILRLLGNAIPNPDPTLPPPTIDVWIIPPNVPLTVATEINTSVVISEDCLGSGENLKQEQGQGQEKEKEKEEEGKETEKHPPAKLKELVPTDDCPPTPPTSEVEEITSTKSESVPEVITTVGSFPTFTQDIIYDFLKEHVQRSRFVYVGKPHPTKPANGSLYYPFASIQDAQRYIHLQSAPYSIFLLETPPTVSPQQTPPRAFSPELLKSTQVELELDSSESSAKATPLIEQELKNLEVREKTESSSSSSSSCLSDGAQSPATCSITTSSNSNLLYLFDTVDLIKGLGRNVKILTESVKLHPSYWRSPKTITISKVEFSGSVLLDNLSTEFDGLCEYGKSIQFHDCCFKQSFISNLASRSVFIEIIDSTFNHHVEVRSGRGAFRNCIFKTVDSDSDTENPHLILSAQSDSCPTNIALINSLIQVPFKIGGTESPKCVVSVELFNTFATQDIIVDGPLSFLSSNLQLLGVKEINSGSFNCNPQQSADLMLKSTLLVDDDDTKQSSKKAKCFAEGEWPLVKKGTRTEVSTTTPRLGWIYTHTISKEFVIGTGGSVLLYQSPWVEIDFGVQTSWIEFSLQHNGVGCLSNSKINLIARREAKEGSDSGESKKVVSGRELKWVEMVNTGPKVSHLSFCGESEKDISDFGSLGPQTLRWSFLGLWQGAGKSEVKEAGMMSSRCVIYTK